MRHILVSGGFGFLGSHRVENHLSLGHKVIVIDNMTAKGGILYRNEKAINFELDLRDDKTYKILNQFRHAVFVKII